MKIKMGIPLDPGDLDDDLLPPDVVEKMTNKLN